MPLLGIFGIGVIEVIILLGCVAIFGAIVVGIVVAIAFANRGKDDRRQ